MAGAGHGSAWKCGVRGRVLEIHEVFEKGDAGLELRPRLCNDTPVSSQVRVERKADDSSNHQLNVEAVSALFGTLDIDYLFLRPLWWLFHDIEWADSIAVTAWDAPCYLAAGLLSIVYAYMPEIE